MQLLDVLVRDSANKPCIRLYRQNVDQEEMLCAFITFPQLKKQKNKWTKHIKQNQLCYAEKSPTVFLGVDMEQTQVAKSVLPQIMVR